MKILIFGSYNPKYSRNRVLLRGLQENGVIIEQCNVFGKGILKFIKLAIQYTRVKKDYDAILVPFPGQEVMILARFLTRKPIIFDAFTSHYEGYILDRKKYGIKSLHAYWYWWLDRLSCCCADLVLLDTQAHINFFIKNFHLKSELFQKLYVGTDSSVMKPRIKKENTGLFHVFFYGHFIPLQGVRYIVEAADILRDEPVVFTIIGNGQTFQENRKLAESLALQNIRWIEPISYEALPDYIKESDVCLGIFGDTSKTNTVIPNKVFDALACGSPLITARTDATEELLTDRKNVLFCIPANAQDLAEKILFLKNNPETANRIGREGYDLFAQNLTEKILGQQLVNYIEKIL